MVWAGFQVSLNAVSSLRNSKDTRDVGTQICSLHEGEDIPEIDTELATPVPQTSRKRGLYLMLGRSVLINMAVLAIVLRLSTGSACPEGRVVNSPFCKLI
jgi:hypothetical protein